MDKNTLIQTITKASQEYYNGTPIMTDAQFDSLLEQLSQIDPKHPLLTQVGHGYVQSDSLNKIKHPRIITRGLPKKKVEPNFILPKGYLTPKYDGSSVTLYYNNGILDKAITRADGIYGFDITDKMSLLVPTKIDKRIKVVTGEFLLSYENLKKYYPNEDAIRNIATGAMNKPNYNKKEITRFDFVAYRINFGDFTNITYPEILNLLRENNFITPDTKVAYNGGKDFTYIFNKYKTYSHKGHTFAYDGIVYCSGIEIKGDEILYKNELAYKTLTETATATVKYIEWNHSDKGRIKPTVVFDTVHLSGADIQRATGFNAQYIKENGIDTGAVVEITRSGEVIPYILNTISSVDAKLPTRCECGELYEWDGVDLVCVNKNCSLNKYKTLCNYIKIVCNTKGFSDKAINALIEHENWKDVFDIYNKVNNNFDNLYNKDGIGDSTVELIMNAFDKLYDNIQFETWLKGLNIEALSDKNISKYSKDIYKYLNEKDKNIFNNYTPYIKGVIIKNLPYITSFYELTNKYIQKPITRLKAQNNVNICITGTLSKPRKELLEEFNAVGAVESSIQKADILICNEPSSSSKYKYAIKNNVKIMTEDEFRKYIRSV